MNEVFDEDDQELVEDRRDTEVTLGPMLLLALFFALVMLCGLCFGLGYALGSRNAHGVSTTDPHAAAPAIAPSSSKPSAAPQNLPQPQSVAVSQSVAAASEVEAAQPVVKPALPATATLLPTESPAQTGEWMVQIAAVSHPEDADVLVGALHKRGYAATVRRDAADRLIQVRIGPFTQRTDAETIRRKLLNDGYNAIVQP